MCVCVCVCVREFETRGYNNPTRSPTRTRRARRARGSQRHPGSQGNEHATKVEITQAPRVEHTRQHQHVIRRGWAATNALPKVTKNIKMYRQNDINSRCRIAKPFDLESFRGGHTNQQQDSMRPAQASTPLGVWREQNGNQTAVGPRANSIPTPTVWPTGGAQWARGPTSD